MVGGKRASEGKSKPFCEHTAIEFEMKIGMICKYEGGQIFIFEDCILLR
jgi:hypothetical protein